MIGLRGHSIVVDAYTATSARMTWFSPESWRSIALTTSIRPWRCSSNPPSTGRSSTRWSTGTTPTLNGRCERHSTTTRPIGFDHHGSGVVEPRVRSGAGNLLRLPKRFWTFTDPSRTGHRLKWHPGSRSGLNESAVFFTVFGTADIVI